MKCWRRLCGGVVQVVASPKGSAACSLDPLGDRGGRRAAVRTSCQTGVFLVINTFFFFATTSSLVFKSDHKQCIPCQWQNSFFSLSSAHLLFVVCFYQRYGHYNPLAPQRSVSCAPAGNNVRDNPKEEPQSGSSRWMSRSFLISLYKKKKNNCELYGTF